MYKNAQKKITLNINHRVITELSLCVYLKQLNAALRVSAIASQKKQRHSITFQAHFKGLFVTGSFRFFASSYQKERAILCGQPRTIGNIPQYVLKVTLYRFSGAGRKITTSEVLFTIGPICDNCTWYSLVNGCRGWPVFALIIDHFTLSPVG